MAGRNGSRVVPNQLRLHLLAGIPIVLLGVPWERHGHNPECLTGERSGDDTDRTLLALRPLPQPETRSGYEIIVPGAADRIIKMAENQLATVMVKNQRVSVPTSSSKAAVNGWLFWLRWPRYSATWVSLPSQIHCGSRDHDRRGSDHPRFLRLVQAAKGPLFFSRLHPRSIRIAFVSSHRYRIVSEPVAYMWPPLRAPSEARLAAAVCPPDQKPIYSTMGT